MKGSDSKTQQKASIDSLIRITDTKQGKLDGWLAGLIRTKKVGLHEQDPKLVEDLREMRWES